jgi:hypothetical protein
MAISEQMLAMLLALHVPAGHDGGGALGPEALTQPSGGVVLADSSSASHKLKLNNTYLTIDKAKASTTLDTKQGFGDIKGESQDKDHKDWDMQHTKGQGGQKGEGVHPHDRNAPGQ